MNKATLTRLSTDDQGTFGILRVDDVEFFTGELPWRDNENNISCIPTGEYVCRWTLSNRFKKFMYQVDGVEDRTGIRIHAANFVGDDTKRYRKQLNGCIALGEKIGEMGGQKALLVSAPAIRKFETLMNKKTFILEVIDGIG